METPIRIRTRPRPAHRSSGLCLPNEFTSDMMSFVAREHLAAARAAAEQEAAEDAAHAAEGHMIQQRQDAIDEERARQLRSKPAPAARRRRRAINL